MKKTFEIRIPKEFLKSSLPDWEAMDFILFLTVNYWYNDNGELIMLVEHPFNLGEYLKWDNPRLKQYLTAACENNHENTKEPEKDYLTEIIN
jgi:hypothetical protein